MELQTVTMMVVKIGRIKMNNKIRFCSILDDVCPEKTDGEPTYCNYYCKLHRTYRDYKYKSKEMKEGAVKDE